jgi:hypothetical protein
VPEREIESGRWSEFCDGYSRQHRGWLASLGSSESGDCNRVLDSAQARDLRFEGLHPGGAEDVLVVRLGDGRGHLSHEVRGVARLISEETTDGVHQGLRIESVDGSTTCLRFRVPAAPEALDGLAKQER